MGVMTGEICTTGENFPPGKIKKKRGANVLYGTVGFIQKRKVEGA